MLELLAILVCSDKSFCVPKYMGHCIDVEDDQAYKIGTGFDIEDGMTMVLEDDDKDLRLLDVCSLLQAWRQCQSFVSDLSLILQYLPTLHDFFSPSQPHLNSSSLISMSRAFS